MKKKSMSVREMRRLLGLGKTEAYWLVKKSYVDTVIIAGKMRVMIESFENWYANQLHYKKIIEMCIRDRGMMFRNTDALMERANRSITTLNSVMIEYISGMKLIKAYNLSLIHIFSLMIYRPPRHFAYMGNLVFY